MRNLLVLFFGLLFSIGAHAAECFKFEQLNLGASGQAFNKWFSILQGSFYGGRSCSLEAIPVCAASVDEVMDVACPESRNCRVSKAYDSDNKRVLMVQSSFVYLPMDFNHVSTLGHELVHACLHQTDHGETSEVGTYWLYRWEEFLAYLAQASLNHYLAISPDKEMHFTNVFMNSFFRRKTSAGINP